MKTVTTKILSGGAALILAAGALTGLAAPAQASAKPMYDIEYTSGISCLLDRPSAVEEEARELGVLNPTVSNCHKHADGKVYRDVYGTGWAW